MAKIQSKTIKITFNKIVKDNDNSTFDLSPDIAKTLEEVAQEMCDPSIVIESEVSDE